MEDEEEYESFSEEDDDDEFGYSGLGAGSADRPVFEEAQYKYAKSMSTSQYLKDVVPYIKRQPLTARYKRSLISCVYALFSEEEVLANNNPRIKSKFVAIDALQRKLIFAQRNIELCRCDMTKLDKYNLNTYALEKYILGVYESYITRTIGDKRERIINADARMINISQNELIKNNNNKEQPKKKKGFLGLGR